MPWPSQDLMTPTLSARHPWAVSPAPSRPGFFCTSKPAFLAGFSGLPWCTQSMLESRSAMLREALWLQERQPPLPPLTQARFACRGDHIQP